MQGGPRHAPKSSASHLAARSGSDLPTRDTHRGGPSHLSSLSSTSFPKTSVPAGCHGGGPGVSLSHLIASLHRDRPSPHSQKTAKIWWLQRFTGKGSGCSPRGGHSHCLQSAANAGKPSPEPLGPQQQPKVFLHTQKPKADPGCHPRSPPPAPGGVQSHPLGPTPLTPLRGNPVLPRAAQFGYHLRQPRSARWSFPKFCYKAISPART